MPEPERPHLTVVQDAPDSDSSNTATPFQAPPSPSEVGDSWITYAVTALMLWWAYMLAASTAFAPYRERAHAVFKTFPQPLDLVASLLCGLFLLFCPLAIVLIVALVNSRVRKPTPLSESELTNLRVSIEDAQRQARENVESQLSQAQKNPEWTERDTADFRRVMAEVEENSRKRGELAQMQREAKRPLTDGSPTIQPEPNARSSERAASEAGQSHSADGASSIQTPRKKSWNETDAEIVEGLGSGLRLLFGTLGIISGLLVAAAGGAEMWGFSLSKPGASMQAAGMSVTLVLIGTGLIAFGLTQWRQVATTGSEADFDLRRWSALDTAQRASIHFKRDAVAAWSAFMWPLTAFLACLAVSAFTLAACFRDPSQAGVAVLFPIAASALTAVWMFRMRPPRPATAVRGMSSDNSVPVSRNVWTVEWAAPPWPSLFRKKILVYAGLAVSIAYLYYVFSAEAAAWAGSEEKLSAIFYFCMLAGLAFVFQKDEQDLYLKRDIKRVAVTVSRLQDRPLLLEGDIRFFPSLDPGASRASWVANLSLRGYLHGGTSDRGTTTSAKASLVIDPSGDSATFVIGIPIDDPFPFSMAVLSLELVFYSSHLLTFPFNLPIEILFAEEYGAETGTKSL